MSKNRLLVLTMLGYLLAVGLDIGGFQLALLNIAKEYELSYTWMSSLVLVKCLASFSCVLLVGLFADKLGKKKVLFGAATVYTIGSFILLFTSSVEWTFISVTVIGMSFGICEGMPTALLADEYPDKSDQYVSLSQAIVCIGAIVGPIIESFFLKRMDNNWRGIYILLVSLVGLMTVFLVFVKPTAIEVKTKEDSLKETSGSGIVMFPVVMLIVAMFMYSGMENGMGYFMDTIFDRGFGEPGFSAIALSGFWVTMLVMRMVCVVMKKNHDKLCLACFVLSIVTAFLLSRASSGRQALVLSLIFGLCCGPIWGLLVSFALKKANSKSGMVASWMSAASAIGASVFPFLMGKAADISGVMNSIILISVIAFLGTVFFSVYFVKEKFF